MGRALLSVITFIFAGMTVAPRSVSAQEAPFSNGPYLTWHFDEDSGARRFIEVHGDERNPRCIGTECVSSGGAGKFGKSLVCDTASKVVRIPKSTINEIGPFTISVWLRPNPVALNEIHVFLTDERYLKDGFRFGVMGRSTGLQVGLWSTQSGGTLNLESKTPLTANSWNHVVVTYDGSGGALYVNGKLSTTASGLIKPNGNDLLLGRAIHNTAHVGYLGQIDELSFFSSALSTTDASALFQLYQRSGGAFPDLGRAPGALSCPAQTLQAGEPWSYKLAISDPDFDLLKVDVVDAPHGVKVERESGRIWWTPSFAQLGNFTPTFKISDRANHSTNIQCALSVNPASEPAPTALFRLPYPGSHDANLRSDILSFNSNAPYGLAHEGERFSLLSSTGKSIRAFTPHGETVYSGPPGELPLLPIGHYFVESEDDQIQFFVLPSGYRGSSFFGTGTEQPTDVVAIEKSRLLKPTWQRACTNVTWGDIEKSPGVFDWAHTDQVVATSNSIAPKLMSCIMDMPPEWIYARGVDEFVTRYGQFAKLYAQRYRGKMQALEPWNEPNIVKVKGFFPSRDPSIAEISAITERIIIQAHRSIEAATPGAYAIYGPTAEWLNSPYHAGMTSIMGAHNIGAHLNGLDWHDYHYSKIPGDVGTHLSGRLVDRIAEMRKQFGISHYAITEFGLFGESALGFTLDPKAPQGWAASGLPWYLGTRRTMKATITHLASGADFVAPHVMTLYGNWEINGWEQSHVAASGRGVKPQTSSFLMIMHLLDQAHLIRTRELSNLGFLSVWQRKDGTPLVIAWSREGERVPLKADGRLSATDVYGWKRSPDALSDDPLFFTSSSLNAVQLADRIIELSHDGALQSTNEICDGLNLGGQTCQTLGYSGGVLGCSDEGRLITTGCEGALPTSNLMAHFPLNETEGTTAHDSSHNLTATLSQFSQDSTSGWTNTVAGRALRFDGVDDMVAFDNSAGSFFPTDDNAPFSASLWVKPEKLATETFRTILSNEHYGRNGFRMGLLFGSSPALWSFESGGTAFAIASHKSTQDTWMHILFSFDGKDVYVYINGVLSSIDRDSTFKLNTNYLLLGSGISGATGFQGTIKDLMIFNRALGPDEIARIRDYCGEAQCPSTQLIRPNSPSGLKFH